MFKEMIYLKYYSILCETEHLLQTIEFFHK